jgi:serine/threonine protein phosphatase PrpC
MPNTSTLPTLDPPPGSIRAVPAAQLDLAACTDVGKTRERNEDQFVVARLGRWLSVERTSIGVPRELTTPQGTLLVVADGMGGQGAGDVASAVAMDAFVEHSLLEMPWLASGSEGGDSLLLADVQRFVVACQEQLHVVAERKHLPAKLGTTLTAAYVHGSRLVVVHVGDTRAYLLRAGRLERLTHDHTLGAAVSEAAGSAEAGEHLSHVLVNAIGGNADVPRPEVVSMDLRAGDRLLLCSDGLHGTLDDTRISEILTGAKSAKLAVDALVDEVLARGAPDNVTAVAAFG